MTFKYNPLTGRLDLVSNGGGGTIPVVDPTQPSVLGNDGTDLVWLYPNQYIYGADDWIAGRNESTLNWNIQASGGTISTNATGAVDQNHPGIIRLSTGGSSATHVGIGLFNGTDQGPFLLGGGELVLEYLIHLNALSDAIDNYNIFVGLSDRFGSEPFDGIYFMYNHANNSGNWQIKTADNGTRTTGNTTTAVVADWMKLKIIVNADATSVSFYVDDVEVDDSPITTNIPTDGTKSVGPYFNIQKTAGTTARILSADYFNYFHILTTPR